MGSIELGRGCCLYREPEEGAHASVCAPDNGRLGSGNFCWELEEETAAAVSTALTVPVPSETELSEGAAAAAAGDRDLWKKLRLVGVMVVVSLPAGLSTVSTPCEVGGEAALTVAGEAEGGLSSFRGSSGDSEE